MKAIKVSEARKLLEAKGCQLIRPGSHEIWKNPKGETFSLPIAHREVSPGVLRKLYRFMGER